MQTGRTYGEWSALWWQYVLGKSVNDPNSPLLDPTGKGCAAAQPHGRPVFFQTRQVDWLQSTLFEAVLTPSGLLLAGARDNAASNAVRLGVSPEGRRVLLDLGDELRILERDSGKWLGSLNSRRQGRFQGLAEFSPSGRLVLTDP